MNYPICPLHPRRQMNNEPKCICYTFMSNDNIHHIFDTTRKGNLTLDNNTPIIKSEEEDLTHVKTISMKNNEDIKLKRTKIKLSEGRNKEVSLPSIITSSMTLENKAKRRKIVSPLLVFNYTEVTL